MEEIEEEEHAGCIIQIITPQLTIFMPLSELFLYILEKMDFKDMSGNHKIIFTRKIADHDGSVLVLKFLSKFLAFDKVLFFSILN